MAGSKSSALGLITVAYLLCLAAGAAVLAFAGLPAPWDTLAADVVATGWGVPHMWAGTRLSAGFVMVFGPRDREELVTVTGIVEASHAYASGTAAGPA